MAQVPEHFTGGSGERLTHHLQGLPRNDERLPEFNIEFLDDGENAAGKVWRFTEA